jgi:hypothetical protein
MIEIGRINSLEVFRETSSGYYLVCAEDDQDDEEVFLPPAMAPKDVAIGDIFDAFVYVDTKDQLIATSKIPFAQVGEYAFLEVVEVQNFGAFLDWGIEKDLLIPGNEQKWKLKLGESCLVRICLEEGTDRIFATTKYGKYLEDVEFDIEEKEEVEVIPVEFSELGYRVIINRKYLGLLYKNEVFAELDFDESYTGFVKKLRKDGLVDVALQVQGIKNLDEARKTILEHLENNNGVSFLHDKSSPEEIRDKLKMSKKTFKNSLGMLYRDKKIVIHKDRIEKVKS